MVHVLLLFLVGVLKLPTSIAQLGDSDEYKPGWEYRCKYQPNSWNCTDDKEHRFYYDQAMQTCKTFVSGLCDLNFNSFAALSQCSVACIENGHKPFSVWELQSMPIDVTCRLQYDFGTGHAYQPMWYYDISERTCRSFSYSGYGGNGNKFPSASACMNTCDEAVANTYEKMEPKLIM